MLKPVKFFVRRLNQEWGEAEGQMIIGIKTQFTSLQKGVTKRDAKNRKAEQC